MQISFEISEGMPAHINKVLIEGNSKTKEKVIRRELFSRPGDIFRRSVLMRSMRNVMVLNYFNPGKRR
jgi:outer membrane protein insertion porin family